MIKELKGGGMVITGTQDINAFRLLALRSALRLETLGLRNSHGSVAQIVRGILGVKTRDRKRLLAQFEAQLRDAGVLTPA